MPLKKKCLIIAWNEFWIFFLFLPNFWAKTADFREKKVVFCLVVKGVYPHYTLVVRPLKKHFFMCVFPYGQQQKCHWCHFAPTWRNEVHRCNRKKIPRKKNNHSSLPKSRPMTDQALARVLQHWSLSVHPPRAQTEVWRNRGYGGNFRIQQKFTLYSVQPL